MSGIQEKLEADTDTFDREDSTVFAESYTLTTSADLAPSSKDNEIYGLHMALNRSKSTLALALSDSNVALFDPETAKHGATIKNAHEKSIVGLKFNPNDDEVFFTASADESVKMWDLRESREKSVAEFRVANSGEKKEQGRCYPGKPLASFDVSKDGRFLCSGTEQVISDAFLLFWDVRSKNLLGGYWDSHEDDVTSVAFHPDVADRLVSGGVDGIVNVFDVSQNCEDEAVLTSLNTESSVQKLRWSADGDNVACVTHTEDFFIWNTEDVSPFRNLPRDEICRGMRRNVEERTYIVDVLNDKVDSFLLTASSCPKNPCLRLLRSLPRDEVKKKKYSKKGKKSLSLFADLKPASSDAFRCSILTENGKNIFVSGENGRLCLWTKVTS